MRFNYKVGVACVNVLVCHSQTLFTQGLIAFSISASALKDSGDSSVKISYDTHQYSLENVKHFQRGGVCRHCQSVVLFVASGL